MKSQSLEDAMLDNFMPFATYTILDRAIPMIDGFKPSQRRILYTMFEKGYTHNKPYVKSNTIEGDVMKIHPHGGSYKTMVRMTDGHEALGAPFIDSKGNFGKLYSRDTKEAAMRYTEARLNEFASELFKGIKQGAVDMKSTYDGQGIEPILLPVPYPVALTNSTSGVAVSIGSDIPPFNFHEVNNYAISILEGKNDDILKHIPSPDFPIENTIVYDAEEMRKIMETGAGSFSVRASYTLEDGYIHFKHVPHFTKYEAILDKISELSKEGKLKEVLDAHDTYGMNDDGSDSTGIQVEYKKGTDVEKLLDKLFRLTSLEETFSVNLNLVIDNIPQVLGVTRVIKEWIKFRKETIVRMARNQLKNNELQLEKLQGLDAIKNILDEVISTIRSTESNNIPKALQSKFNLSEVQADYITNIQLRNLAKDYILKRTEEINTLIKDNSLLSDLMENENSLNQHIIKQLKELNKKYSFPRRTEFVSKADVVETRAKNNQKLIEIDDYNLKMFITNDLYLKKLPLTSMRGKFNNRLKEDDSFVIEEELTNTGELVVFTDKRNVYKKRIHEIEDVRPSELGEYIPSMFDYEKGEKPLFALPLRKEFDQHIILGFSDGTIAKIDSKAYHTKQNRQLLKNGYADKELIYVGLSESISYNAIKAITSDNYAVVRDLDRFSSKSSRGASGNKFMTVNEGEKVVKYTSANEDDIDKYEIASAGKGRRVK